MSQKCHDIGFGNDFLAITSKAQEQKKRMDKLDFMKFSLNVQQKGRSRHGAVETNPARNHEVMGSIAGLAQRVKDLVN